MRDPAVLRPPLGWWMRVELRSERKLSTFCPLLMMVLLMLFEVDAIFTVLSLFVSSALCPTYRGEKALVSFSDCSGEAEFPADAGAGANAYSLGVAPRPISPLPSLGQLE